MDIAIITGAIASLNAAFDAAKNTISGAVYTQAKAQLGELQDALFTLRARAAMEQEGRIAAERKVTELEDQIKKLTDNAERLKDYELADQGAGSYVLVRKATSPSAEPKHWLCATCGDKLKVSRLQLKGPDRSYYGNRLYTCPECRNDITIDESITPAGPVQPRHSI